MENQSDVLRGWGSIPTILVTSDPGKRSSRKQWCETEMMLLRKHWPNVNKLQMLLHGRTKESIRQMAMKKGLAKRVQTHWAPAEVQLLVDIYPRSDMETCLQKLPGRTEKAIRAKADSLGLIRLN